jgi:hypothetical protein
MPVHYIAREEFLMKKAIIFLLLIILLQSCCLAQKVLKLQGKGEGYWRIKPGIGVGDVKVGMAYNQLQDILGEPDLQEGKVAKQEMCTWSKYGLQINLINNKATQITVKSGTIEGKECKTREGITISSKADLVVSKFGSDYTKKPPNTTDAYNAMVEAAKLPDCLIYKEKGIFFNTASSTVNMIGVFRPGVEPVIKN